MKTLALPLCGFELDMEYNEAYQLQTSQNPFLPFCYSFLFLFIYLFIYFLFFREELLSATSCCMCVGTLIVSYTVTHFKRKGQI